MADLPTGTVTFLFTDIEGSTRLLEHIGDHYADVLKECQQLLRTAVHEGSGQEMGTLGDAFYAVFPRAKDALKAAVSAQRSLLGHSWPGGMAVRVRIGLHTGEPLADDSGYVGLVVHRAARICAAGHGGQILLSRVTHDLIEDDFSPDVILRDLGLHRLKDLASPQHLFQVVAANLPDDFPPLRAADVVLNNLPRTLSSFIGRGREKAEVRRLLSFTRLLTLAGSGGAGKTRLALHVAEEVLKEFPDGVWLAELASISDPALVPQMVASAVGVREQLNWPLLATLMDSLRQRHLLLVLDNCEHLVAACASLAESLLRTCPHLRILTTSREPLGVAGETTWRVPSLSLPDPHGLPSLDRLKDYEAVHLFVERAVASQPDFEVTEENASDVVQVCRRLDGIPLAIELAAALMKMLTVEQIAARLDDRFRLLTGGARMALPHNQTLLATMDWSYDLLSKTERTVLRRLSVFAGGWTLEAAEAICSEDGIDAADVLNLQARLVEKSLVIAETRGEEARYRLLETTRRYAQDRLLDAGETEGVRKRHRDWYLGLAEGAHPEIHGTRQTLWLERLETEHENLRAALEWSKTEKETDPGLRLAGALWDFWQVRGYVTEGRQWLQTMLSRSRDSPPPVRAKALVGAGILAWRQRDYEFATMQLQESMTFFRELGDLSGGAQALHFLGVIAEHHGDYDRARTLLAESLVNCRKSEDKRRMAVSLNSLGEVARCQGDYVEAHALYEESLELRREMGEKRGVAIALGNLGHVALYQGDVERARALFTEALSLAGELVYKVAIAEYLEGLAGVAVADGRPARAARLLAAAECLLTALHGRLEPPDQAEYERTIAAARAGLGDAAFGEAWAEGSVMTLEQAIEYAMKRNV